MRNKLKMNLKKKKMMMIAVQMGYRELKALSLDKPQHFGLNSSQEISECEVAF